jgi:hypothetical protein
MKFCEEFSSFLGSLGLKSFFRLKKLEKHENAFKPQRTLKELLFSFNDSF